MSGGRNGAASVSDLWAYDPTANTWTNLNPATSDHPSTIGFPSMAYDASAHKAIFFGSALSGMVISDTWAYDPSAKTWTRLNPAGDVPSARVGQRLVYDPGTGKVILFGGWLDGTAFDAIWTYDYAANTWTELHPAGDVPPGRVSHSMVYDSASGTVVLFGGLGGGGTCLDDTWAYDPVANTWTELYPAGEKPSARSGHSMFYDSGVGKVILFGGLEADDTYLSDTWDYGVEP